MEALLHLPAVNIWKVLRVQIEQWLPPCHIACIRVGAGLLLGTKEVLLTFLVLCSHH